MDSILTVASGSAAQVMAYTTGLFSDLWIIVGLVIGIPLAFYVIRKVIGMVRMH
jgi:hypothetical protein